MAEAHATEWLLSDHAGFWATSVSPLKKTLTRKTEAMCASLPSPAQPICEVEGRGILSLPTSPGPLDLFRDHNSVCSLDPGSRHPNTQPRGSCGMCCPSQPAGSLQARACATRRLVEGDREAWTPRRCSAGLPLIPLTSSTLPGVPQPEWLL